MHAKKYVTKLVNSAIEIEENKVLKFEFILGTREWGVKGLISIY